MDNIYKTSPARKIATMGILIFICIFTTTAIAAEASLFEIRAKIMLLQLDEDLAIIAEKEIHLKAHFEHGKKVWDTLFLDTQGNVMDPTDLQERDRVYVLGAVTNDTIVADEVRLLQ